MAKFDLKRLREVAIPINQRPRKHTEQEKEDGRKRLHDYFAKGNNPITSTPNMKTVAELIKELSELDQSKPIWIHYDMAYSQIPEISVADADTYDCNDKIKTGDYLL